MGSVYLNTAVLDRVVMFIISVMQNYSKVGINIAEQLSTNICLIYVPDTGV